VLKPPIRDYLYTKNRKELTAFSRIKKALFD